MKSHVRHWLLIFALIVQSISPGFAMAHQVITEIAPAASADSDADKMPCHSAKQTQAALQKAKKHCECCDQHCQMLRCASIAWLVPWHFSWVVLTLSQHVPDMPDAEVIARRPAPPTPPPNLITS
jgi:hypothetical protein